MVKWSEIKDEYEGLEVGFRERVVDLFRRHEGEETDEKVRGKVVKVTVASFAKHMGIPRVTFLGWVESFSTVESRLSTLPDPTPTCVNAGLPAREGFVREATARIRECIPIMHHLSEYTHELIEMDLLDLEEAIAEVRRNLKVSI